jgi:hypothetical protein
MTIREELTAQALTLAPEDRLYIADMLEQSLSTGEFATPEIAQAWSVEIDRRLSAYERGEIAADDAESALTRMQQQLATHRQQRG